MMYGKGDTFILTCYADRALDKIGVITGEGKEYNHICEKNLDPCGFFLSSRGEIIKYTMIRVRHNTSVHYPVLIGDQTGWIAQDCIEGKYDVQ